MSNLQLLSLALLAASFMITTSVAGTGIPCYTISNYAVPNYVNLTFNSTKFTVRLNFIGPSSAGITLNDNSSYNLTLGRPLALRYHNANYTSELLNVSWLPVEHSVIINFCSISYVATASSSTTSILTSTSVPPTTVSTSILPVPVITSSNTTSTIPQSHPTRSNGSWFQGLINWLKSIL